MRDQDASPTRLELVRAEWLDVHYAACAPEYEAMLRLVGLQPSWHMLDAGCGGGSYLPLLAQLIGPMGRVAAIDFNAENISVVRKRLSAWNLPCPVSAEVGSLLALPYPDNSFDAIWSANVTQYLSEVELPMVLAEFRRVVRPGGLVALKDVDMQLMRIYPANPFLISHLSEKSVQASDASTQSHGSLRGRELRRWLERAGLEQVWQRTIMIERWAPLQPIERQFFAEWFTYLARVAEERGVAEEDLRTWRRLRDSNAPDYLVDSPDFYVCEGQIVSVGHVPEPAS
ncbi:MAG: methyltransferase domain-containing protein [Chloroflexota bacterium]|nr:methyltransferase domain-containing protein [Chloroflexota bacterium]